MAVDEESRYEYVRWVTVLPDGTRYGSYDTREQALTEEPIHREAMLLHVAEMAAMGRAARVNAPAKPVALIRERTTTVTHTTTDSTTEAWPNL
ncbi:hypothetical protein [Rathayibacter sp. VKM Ac-2630]|uniref:hypothetical protein n=1 Tax=Rathayibacter sp. VKM Ac-2630 TaxID=1938617 RepID=UPI0009824C23|nr:hypothetical protein [Rathayibacter sp. VKM Ac-2630]OOB91204.1 hypothetical protein B0T42_07345 [Rathayibacter sp. VKM Ac-2630]